MKTNFKTSLAGLLFIVTAALSQAGITVGRIGNSDWISIINKVAATIGLAYAKDKDVTGTGDKAKRDPEG